MDTTRSTAHDLPTWREAVLGQGRTLHWIARQTGKSQRTIYAYSRGELVPSDDWLAEVAALLATPVRHVERRAA